MPKKSVVVMIGGEAGQGLVTIGQVLSKALVRAGYELLVSQDYMSRVRGGHNTFTIRASVDAIEAPREGVDLLVALNQQTLELHQDELNQGAQVVADQGLTCGQASCLQVPYKELTEGRYINTVALGVAGFLLGLDKDTLAQALGKLLGKKFSDSIKQKNLDALEAAYGFAEKNRPDFAPLAPAPGRDGRLMVNGNEAIGLGALSAGLKFLAFYPMTPSTSIALTVIAAAERMGVVYEQAEDEIAAINMALGASYAGAPAMVCTSGGGFALMNEGVSLAGITETPVLIAISQRPGPATGLPTRTEQGDLLFVLHAGHGEFPRAIFAPGSVEQCFDLTHRALHLAERSQGPVFLLTDQYLADCYRSVEPFALGDLKPVRAGQRGQLGGWDYRRYAPSEDGLSPRAIPGLGKELVAADSDEHDEYGHITEDADVRNAQNQKRLRKLRLLLDEVQPPEFGGEEGPELMLVCWGSLRGAVKEAAAELSAAGTPTGWCHFSQVWPLAPEQFADRLAGAARLVMVESNATGQFAGLLEKEAGVEPDEMVLRFDGRPITPEYIQRALDR